MKGSNIACSLTSSWTIQINPVLNKKLYDGLSMFRVETSSKMQQIEAIFFILVDILIYTIKRLNEFLDGPAPRA